MRSLNLGILAHVDAGKTSLTERLLHAAGVLDAVGSVDAGSTLTDSLELERRRGITIKSAVASFTANGVAVNLIDTPGHPDFIAEVERALGVLDGAVLVLSAVEGVQPQTRVLMRTLRRLRVPTLLFVNKIDRRGARDVLVTRLTPASVALASVTGLGTRDAAAVPYGADDPAFTARLADVLTRHDDALLAAYLDGPLPYARLRTELAAQTRRALVHPVLFGSAITGAGVAPLIDALTELLPAEPGAPDAPPTGTVFKVERGPAGEKIAYARLFTGTVRVRDRLRYGRDGEGKVTALTVFEHGADAPAASFTAGRIAKLWGLPAVRIGDELRAPSENGSTPTRSAHFPPPTLETVVVPSRPSDDNALHVALTQLAEQDPLINVRRDDGQTSVSLYGEVQKEVLQATLANDYGVHVTFRETTTVHVERPIATGSAAEFLHTPTNPYLATIGLRVEPAPSGVTFALEVELGSMPYAFFKAVEETVHETLRRGPQGWRVIDCTVTMTHSGYLARQSSAHGGFDKNMSSTAGDFRALTPIVLRNALKQAGTRVYEPMHRFTLDVPADTLGTVLPALARLRAVPQTSSQQGESAVLEGTIPAASIHALDQRLPGLTSGEGTLEHTFSHHTPL
ncbi:GTP-binding protein [Actinomadura yumaensis]|uniref:GTP-binding protein n=1 Tax=Actinomadura yumaensis TaxID=111807 RepID=A0ABW2C9Q7_9ACTN